MSFVCVLGRYNTKVPCFPLDHFGQVGRSFHVSGCRRYCEPRFRRTSFACDGRFVARSSLTGAGSRPHLSWSSPMSPSAFRCLPPAAPWDRSGLRGGGGGGFRMPDMVVMDLVQCTQHVHRRRPSIPARSAGRGRSVCCWGMDDRSADAAASDPPPEPPELEALARRWLDLWQDHWAATARRSPRRGGDGPAVPHDGRAVGPVRRGMGARPGGGGGARTDGIRHRAAGRRSVVGDGPCGPARWRERLAVDAAGAERLGAAPAAAAPGERRRRPG